MIQFNNFDKAPSYLLLKKEKLANLKELLNKERIENFQIPIISSLKFNYACRPVSKSTLKLLEKIAKEQELIEKYKLLLNGEMINTGEKRKVLHQLTRGQCDKKVIEDKNDIGAFYKKELNRFCEFANKVHGGEIVGSTGKKFTQVVQIGIGGSDLGPRAIYLALKGYAVKKNSFKMKGYFISNVDPDDANDVLADIDYETTLFVLVSKSGTTQETLTNQAFVFEKMKEQKIKGFDPNKHMVAVTSATSPLANSPSYLDSFYIDDYIGGRYSSCSAVGGVILSLTFGPAIFKEFLKGAHEADLAAMEKDIYKNASLMDALIGVFERLMGLPTTAVLPYSQALSRFPAHLQQMDMESNGKSVNREGKKISYKTGPVLFGEPGTNGQHSFYQLLHQGTDTVPLQFIGFKKPQYGFDLKIDGSTSQKKLNANLVAQIYAFAMGKDDKNPNKQFNGNRYSSLIFGDELTAKNMGALLAHYENKVMFQGFIWNLNSFDQEGVQLGKVLTKQVLTGKMDEALLALSKFLL